MQDQGLLTQKRGTTMNLFQAKGGITMPILTDCDQFGEVLKETGSTWPLIKKCETLYEITLSEKELCHGKTSYLEDEQPSLDRWTTQPGPAMDNPAWSSNGLPSLVHQWTTQPGPPMDNPAWSTSGQCSVSRIFQGTK